MNGFVIKKEPEKISSVNRTIRLKPELFDKILLESEKTGVSFNKIVNQCVEYAFSNIIEESNDEH